MKFSWSICLLILSCIYSVVSSVSFAQDAASEKSIISPASKCIEFIFSADDSLGKIRNHACERFTLSQAIQQYVQGIERQDFTQCPPGFTQAFTAHKEAWKSMTTITDKYPNLRGEMHSLFKQLETGAHAPGFKIYLQAIWDTWAEVEKYSNPL